MSKPKSNGDFERRIQSVVQLIISALMLWVGYSIVGIGNSVTRLEEKVAAQASKMDERAVQTAKDIAEIKATATAVATTATSTAAALATTVAATAAALAAVATQQKADKK